MSRVVDAVCPPRLGGAFRWVLAASWTTNLGDGIALAAGPLLVASQTSDPFLVAAAGFLQRLPWVLFGLPAGVLVDRHDRRRISIMVNLARATVVGVLALSIVTGTVGVAVVLAVMFLLGTAETFADIASSTLLPMVVPPADLGIANARLGVGHITVNQLAGPPLGALLFAAGMASPFVLQAVCMALGAVLVARITLPAVDPEPGVRSMREEIRDGARWLWSHAPVRTLTLTVLAFNVTFGSTLGILVLYAEQRLGLGPVGFGLLTTVGAIGGIAGTAAYGRLERRLGPATLMRIGLVIETGTHLSLALTTVPAVAMIVLLVFGLHESVWGTTVVTIRQKAVPTEFQGRVSSVYLLALMAGLVVGGVVGGIIARTWGITGPFWFAFAGSCAILVAIWRRLDALASP